jgi:hypothetical protein
VYLTIYYSRDVKASGFYVVIYECVLGDDSKPATVFLAGGVAGTQLPTHKKSIYPSLYLPKFILPNITLLRMRKMYSEIYVDKESIENFH